MAVSNKWMQGHDIYDPELEALLQEYNIQSETDLKLLKQKDWNAIWNQAFVERIKTIKQQSSKQRLEKKMKKLEKLWRKHSGIKVSTVTNTDESHLDSHSASTQISEYALNEAPELRKWLKQKGIWLKDLFEVLVRRGVDGPDDFFMILDDTMVEIKREVRVLRSQDLKSMEAKSRLENILKKFEDEWRKSEGKNKKKKNIYDDHKQNPPMPSQTMKEAAQQELQQKGKVLKEWMRSQGIWQLALYEELINAGVTNPDELGSLKQKEFDEVVRRVKVNRFSEIKNQNARANAEKLLVKCEKLYKKQKK